LLVKLHRPSQSVLVVPVVLLDRLVRMARQPRLAHSLLPTSASVVRRQSQLHRATVVLVATDHLVPSHPLIQPASQMASVALVVLVLVLPLITLVSVVLVTICPARVVVAAAH
jgi:hypothetical protein